MVIKRFVQGQLLGMDFIDGNVQMQVVSIAMHDGDSLMFPVPQLVTNSVFYLPDHIFGRFFPKRQYQVVGFVSLGSVVHFLYRLHLKSSPLGILRFTSRDAYFLHTLLNALGIRQIFDQPADIASSLICVWLSYIFAGKILDVSHKTLNNTAQYSLSALYFLQCGECKILQFFP